MTSFYRKVSRYVNKQIANFRVNGLDRFWRHSGPVAKSRLFPGSLLQQHRLSFLHNIATPQPIVFKQLWFCSTYSKLSGRTL